MPVTKGPPPCTVCQTATIDTVNVMSEAPRLPEAERGPDDEGEQQVEVVEPAEQAGTRKQVAEAELGGEHGAEAQQGDLERARAPPAERGLSAQASSSGATTSAPSRSPVHQTATAEGLAPAERIPLIVRAATPMSALTHARRAAPSR